MAKKESEPKTNEFAEDQVWLVGKCQILECGKIRPLAKVAPRAAVTSAGGDVQICKPCYTAHFRGCKIRKKERKQNLLFKAGEARRVV